MISGYFGAGDEALRRASMPRRNSCHMLQPLAGLVLAAGLVLSLAGQYEGQLIRAERIHQEVIGR